MKRFTKNCTDCRFAGTCFLRHNETLRILGCPYVEDVEDDSLDYCNPEGYSDPTAYFALRNVLHDEGMAAHSRPHGTSNLTGAYASGTGRGA